ncbi:MAG: transcription-repair coupling factor [Planctomycetota bacterium]|nr:transcription-repair coupling factor [Planctomycetota bacterium]
MSQVAPHAEAATSLKTLGRRLSNVKGFDECIAALQSGEPVSFEGVPRSAHALLVSELADRAPSTLMVVTPDSAGIDDLYREIPLYSNERLTEFPRWEADDDRPLVDGDYGRRIGVLKKLANGQPEKIMAAEIKSLLSPCPSPDSIRENSRTISTGQQIDVDEFLKWLADHNLHPTTAVELPGEFSSRGGIIDLFAWDWTLPVRIELFDDEIESIREFSPQTQRSLRPLESVGVTTLHHSQQDRTPFAEYLPEETWVVFLEPEEIEDQAREFLKLVSHPARFLGLADVRSGLMQYPHATSAELALGTSLHHCRLPLESVGRIDGDLGEIRVNLDHFADGYQSYVITRTEGEIERLIELLGTTRTAASGRLNYVVGDMRTGFRWISEKTLVVDCDHLFNRGQMRRQGRRRMGKAIDSFLDLQDGDLVVHIAHGIGRYRGLKMLEKEDQVEEHLELEFDGGTKIFVPATKIDLVQKYIGGSKTRPRLAKIGGKSWVRQKKAAESAVQDMAAEMIELQASRSARPGIAFSRETEWLHEFERSFPFRETPDQLASLKDIHQDMCTAKPMDRLLCGDVGFGKTEVAMRAAFRAVENGFQVAVLAPTTILVEQHYHSFSQRMAEFPICIEKLSRFCSSSEQRQTVEGLKSGRVDIVIGTHRLASRDVDFFNLGLLIIDEEQRFGVDVKERLKTLKSMVDVLTMSATPIPRTLHMSLVGVRDISNLESPPEERMSVETRTTRFDEQVIRSAVLRELNRGGQVFFVHNRVSDIELLKQKLNHIVPEASVVVGHGQMPEGQLEQVMKDFIDHRYDVLLATTIIESGVDIPNANTIFIDEADRYGLSDLHQLRGRVGRYKNQAYCYLLIDPSKHLNPTAAKRLQAIQQYSEMGAGFAIAMRDLEIRGAGNLLGTEQSGHIAAVGYEFYCQLLENAVRQLKKLPRNLEVNVDIDLPGSAFLPDDYIVDRRQKIDIYRRMTRIDKFDQIKLLANELKDRFGPLPKPARRLIVLGQLRLLAATWQINSIFVNDGGFLVFKYSVRSRMEQLRAAVGNRIRIADQNTVYIKLKEGKIHPDRLIKSLKTILQANPTVH